MKREKIKLSLFADNRILYLKHPENFTKKLLYLTNIYSMVQNQHSNAGVSIYQQ